MAGSTAEQRQALLGGEEQEEVWSRVEAGPPRDGPSVQELIGESPHEVIRTLQSTGVQRLACFIVPDQLVLKRLGEGKIITMGADRPDIDAEAAWRKELGPCCPPENARRKAGWCSEMPVQAYVVSIRNASYPAEQGLLQPLLRRWSSGGCSHAVFALPAVAAVIDFKWTRFASRLLLTQLACFSLWVISHFAFALSFQEGGADQPLRWGSLPAAAQLSAVVTMTPFLLLDASALVAYGCHWLLSAWGLLSTATYALQAAMAAAYFWMLPATQPGAWLPVVVAVQSVLLLLRIQQFTRVFPAYKFCFLEDLVLLLREVSWPLTFLFCLMVSYTVAFYVLFLPDQAQHAEFRSLPRTFVTMAAWLAGDPNLGLLYSNASHPAAACLLGLSYMFLLGAVLLTVVVGAFGSILQKINKEEPMRLMLSRAQAIDELESVLPRCCARQLFPGIYPHYIHVLRADPDQLDAVKLDLIWRSVGDAHAAETLQRPSPEGPSTVLRQPSAAPPPSAQQSIHFRGGSLLNAYLGNIPSAGYMAEADDYQLDVLRGSRAEGEDEGESRAEGMSENGTGSAAEDVRELKREVRELKQLLLQVATRLPAG